MPIQILMPALSPTMTEGTLSRWLKKEGDEVKAGQVIAEIETDKATMEVEAVDEGTLGRILIQSGTTGVKVNSVIALLLEEGESPSTLDTALTAAPVVSPMVSAEAKTPEAPVTTAFAAAQPLQGNLQPPLITSPQTEIQRQKITPVAKRLAKQKGLNIALLQGTGPNGRIIKDDVLNAAQAPVSSATKASVSYDKISVDQPYKALPITSVRKVIAQRLTESKQTIPHFYLTVDIEVDHLLAFREEFNKAQSDVKISVNDMIIKALANALVAVPQANAAWAGTEIRQFQRVDISVAVSIEGGLVTPVIRYADGKPLAVIAKEMKSLAERARQGKLKPEDWQGGSATLSNLGMFGVRQFEAIINPPQAAILAVGASEKKPVVRDGNIIVAPVMSCTLSADHRVIDGVLGAQLLAAFKEQLLHPLRLVM